MDEHYFTKKPTCQEVVKEIKINIMGHNFTFRTPSGVFSFGKTDKASILLIENATVKPKSNVLDLGCGWGLIGIVIGKAYGADVTMSDINERAIKLSRENAKINNVQVKIIQSDLYTNLKEKYDTIIVNPPMKAGRELCYKIISDGKNLLNNGGLLQIVAMHNKGGSMLERKMKEVFGNVETVAKKSGFRVYSSVL